MRTPHREFAERQNLPARMECLFPRIHTLVKRPPLAYALIPMEKNAHNTTCILPQESERATETFTRTPS
jgi:hypothetical protein